MSESLFRQFVRPFLLTLVLLVAAAQASAQFYYTAGGQVLDPDGQPTVIRGMGLGGWLMPEGYMLKMGGSWTDMQRKVLRVVDATTAAQVWDLYRENYVAEKDIAALAGWGFDHIRLPFHYEIFYNLETGQFEEEGFALLDEFLGWCRTYDMPVILDMHAAPGGQSDGAIADADGVARLWTEPDPYQDLTVLIWEEIARRYKDETLIIGYDLLNEPVTPTSVPDGAQALRDMYVRLTNAIRAIDTNHILYIEGNYFATTFDKLTPPFDDNMVYAFHKYWSATTIGTIQYIINLRTDHGAPLWLGETGENSNPWFHQVVKLAESNGIGWNFWTHKQLSSTAPPTTAYIRPGFQLLLDYWGGSASKPSEQFAADALFEMVESLKFDSVEVRSGVLEALLDPDFGTNRRPFADLHIPGVIPAVHYDMGNQGVTYSDNSPWAVTGSPGGGNSGGIYRNDGVDIEASTDPQGYPLNVGWLESFEWMEYTVTVDEAGTYDAAVRVASPGGGGSLQLSIDGATANLNIPQTGGWQSWTTVTAPGMDLEAGQHTMRVAVGRTGGFNLNVVAFTRASGVAVEADGQPEPFSLDGLYPNPAVGETTLQLTSSGTGQARIELFDMLGRPVWLASTMLVGGTQHVSIPTKGLAAGLYVVRVLPQEESSGPFTRTLVVER
ncbi:MAG: endoglucanase [Rhodothermales bacterium]|jgi:endoglucanase